MDIAQAGIDRGVFQKVSLGRNVVDVILTRAHTTLQYTRQRRNMGFGIHSSVVFILGILL